MLELPVFRIREGVHSSEVRELISPSSINMGMELVRLNRRAALSSMGLAAAGSTLFLSSLASPAKANWLATAKITLEVFFLTVQLGEFLYKVTASTEGAVTMEGADEARSGYFASTVNSSSGFVEDGWIRLITVSPVPEYNYLFSNGPHATRKGEKTFAAVSVDNYVETYFEAYT